ncbi:MAG: dihydropteroate synthase [Actinomycetota bacterium]|jgi:dihydropteroate synthase
MKLQVMGVLNITPDSFSDGGKFLNHEAALEQAKQLVADGATVLDVGGESTRPGATRVPIEEEIARVVPVIEAIKPLGVDISIDTMNAETALAAIAAGATIINDVSGGKNDPEIFNVAAKSGKRIIISHWRGHSDQMDSLNHYQSIGSDVANELLEQIRKAEAVGVPRSNIIIDPGLGFAKDADQNWQLLDELHELEKLGFPILIGASRKRFIAARLSEPDTVDARDRATATLMHELTQKYDLWGIRVHNVKALQLRQN